MFKKSFLAFLCFLLVFSSSSSFVSAAVEPAPDGIEHVQNNFMDVSIFQENGRFSIQTSEGHPLKNTDNFLPILYEDRKPDTSFTTFRINGKDYIYGNDYGFLGLNSHFSYSPQTKGLTNQSVWHVEGLKITQLLTLVTDPENPNVGNVKITYKVENTSKQNVDVGSRILLDTMLGAYDASPITLAGDNQFIETEKEITDIPLYWRAVDDPIAPKIISYGFLKGWENEPPNRLKIAHWAGISSTKWDYQVNDELNFISDDNPYGSPDSAVAMYWDPKSLAPGEERVYETYYGLGSFFTSQKQANYVVQLLAPKEMEVNESRDGYVDDEFTVSLDVDNTTINSEHESGVQAEISLPPELELVKGESATKYIGDMRKGELKTVLWKVKAKPQTSYKAVRYWVKVQSAGGEEVVQTRFMILPALSGYVPEVQVLDLLPNKKYLLDEKRGILIKGSGFEVLEGNWDVEINLIRERDGQSFSIKDFYVIDDNQLEIDLASHWDELEPGHYRVNIDAGEYGTFDKELEMTMEEQYKSRSYGLLAVTKSDKTYEIVALKSERELDELANRSEEVLIEIRGDITALDFKGESVYEVQPGATINSVISFDRSEALDLIGGEQTLLIQKKDANLIHKKPFIEILGNGVLSIPNFPFAMGTMRILLEDGKNYSLDVTKEDETPITISWESAKWMKMVEYMTYFPVTIKDAVIGEDSISFGGAVNVNFVPPKKQGLDGPNPDLPKEDEEEEDEEENDFNLSVTLDEAKFGLGEDGRYQFIGLRAEGEVGLPKDFVPGMDFRADGRLLVDTLENIYELEADVDFEIFEMNGIFTIRFIDNSIPILDNFVFVVGGEPGIPIIPVAPVAYITKGGGGFKNLYDTVMGNFNVYPPLTFILVGGMDIAKIVSAETMKLTAGLQKIRFDGEFEILGMEFLKSVSGEVAFRDSRDFRVDVTLSAALSILEFINGNISGTFSYDELRNGIMGPVYLAGYGAVDVLVPDYVPVINGEELAGAEASISSEEVFVRGNIWKFTVGVSYQWGDDKPEFDVGVASFADGDSTMNGLGKQVIKDEKTGEVTGVLTFGTNIHKVASSKDQRLMSLMATSDSTNEYSINVTDLDNALFQLNYDGSEPNLELFDPAGNAVNLEEDVFYKVQEISPEYSESGEKEKVVYIGIENPVNGEWKITSDQSLEWSLLELKTLPTIEKVTANKVSENEVEVSWELENASDKKMALYLEELNGDGDEVNSRYLLVKDFDASIGSKVVTLPEEIPSGEYKISAVIFEGERNYDTTVSDDVISYENKNEPVSPENVQATSIGNGYANVKWEFSDEEAVDGFVLQVLDENGQSLDNFGYISVGSDEREVNIGGTYEDISTGELIGIKPGKSYTVSVTSYNEVDGVKILSVPATSEAIFVPKPNPAQVESEISTENGTVQQSVDTEGQPYYTVNQNEIHLSVTSNQSIEANLSVGDELINLGTGQNFEQSVVLNKEGMNVIKINGVNENGDMTFEEIRVHLDSKAPDLKIESPGTSYLAEDSIIQVKGITEPGSTLTVNGQSISLDSEGRFNTNISMNGFMNKTIKIVSEDEIGNRSVYVSEVINDNVDSLERVEIQPIKHETMATISTVDEMDSDVEENIDEGYPILLDKPQTFQLIGIDSEGNSYVLDKADVEWEFLYGEPLGQISEDGVLQASYEGDMVIKATYNLSNEYALEDAMIVRAMSDFNSEPNDGVDPDEYDDWYQEDESDDTSNDDHDNDNNDIDSQLRQILKSIIEAEQTDFIGFANLSEYKDTVIPLAGDGELVVFKQIWDKAVGLGVGKVLNPKEYMSGSLELLGNIYALKTNHPEEFENNPLLTMEFGLEDAPNILKLGIYWFNDKKQRWELMGRDVDPLLGTIKANLQHFGKYALLYNPDLNIYADIEGRWSENSIYRMQSVGYIDGMKEDGDWIFKPTNQITRQEFLKVLVAASEVELTESQVPERFSDRHSISQWAIPYVSTAIKNKWLMGELNGGDAVINPNDELTRAEAAVFIYRILGESFEEDKSSIVTFKDEIPEYARQAIDLLSGLGLISGYPDGTFKPNEPISREEAAVMIQRVLDWKIKHN